METAKIIRSNRRTISLEITPEAVLIIRAPQRVSEVYIEKLVQDKMSWIQKKIVAVKNRPKSQPKEFVDGEVFWYLGESYPLKISKVKKIELKGDLLFPQKFLPKAKIKMAAWYKQEAKEIITERATLYAKQMGVNFTSIKINSAQKRWGSCSHKNHLNFGWKLILQPLEVVDYVVVHELAHIPHKNHSRAFWQLVALHCPDFRKFRKCLRESSY
ncbi:MAG: SprT family zinc-dependent metalloprotease [Patescibacteria group bacterium]|jgi:hypothetical protein